MKIMIINCHTANRGDEAAVHALIDELNNLYKNLDVTVALRGKTHYPNMPDNVKMIKQFMPADFKSLLAFYISKITLGKLKISKSAKTFLEEVETADLVLHAPGGPSIGDTYGEYEASYLRIYDLLIKMKKRYMFYAPSMGPFEKKSRNKWRIRILKNAESVVLRDVVSAEYVKKLVPEIDVIQTLDSAFQHDIDMEENCDKLQHYAKLNNFLENHSKCIGITITDLLWHPVYAKDLSISKNIIRVFHTMLENLTKAGFGIVFIPQLYGEGNDYDLMKSFVVDDNNYFIIPDNVEKYDAYFQQYVIAKMYAVIGMRYHSNIFSAKMGIPFISVSYEQKMTGFMKKMNLLDYCIPIQDFNTEKMNEKFHYLQENYYIYKSYLDSTHEKMKRDSYRTTQIVKNLLERK